MKATIKKEVMQEVEIELPYYATDGNRYFKIVSEEPNKNLSIGVYDNSGNYSVENFVFPDRALHHECKAITAEEFSKIFELAFNKLKYICIH
jgi:hypothetical protein